MIVYGIKNCDTVKKARKWLDGQGMAYSFHDFRADGLDSKTLNGFLKGADWQVLLNKRGTTFRQLSDKDKQVDDARTAAKLMLAHPTLIKRPVITAGKQVIVGFGAEQQDRLIKLA